MGHSQSYDLKNQEQEEKNSKDPVRGVRRVSKEHQTDTNYSVENTENFDNREDELRERIRKEQLMTREAELESMRIRQHESREPIIDAYRTTSHPSPHPPEPKVYKEFNYYDSLKHPNPVDPTTYFVLKPRKEVNQGQRLALGTTVPTVTHHPDYSIPKNSPVEKIERKEQKELNGGPRYVPPGGTYSKRTVETTIFYKDTVPRGTVAAPTVTPQYDTVPGEVESWEKIRAPHYDEVPTYMVPVKRESTVTHRSPLPVTRLEREVPMVPLGVKRTEVPYPSYRNPSPAPVPVPVTVTHQIYRTPTPVKAPSPIPLERILLAQEVSRVPLASTVAQRDPIPYNPASQTKVTVIPVTYRNPSPTPLESTYLTPDVSRVPLVDTVAKKDHVPYNPKTTVIPVTRVYRNPTPSPVLLEPTHLAQEVSKISLGNTVTQRDYVPYNPKVYSTAEPITRYPEVPATPLGHYSNYNTYSTYRTYSTPPTPTQLSEIHAEKRMIVGIEPEEEEEEKENVSYVTVAEFPTYSTATSPSPRIDDWEKIDTLEQLHKHPEVTNRPVYVRPSQSSYQEALPRKSIIMPVASSPPRETVHEAPRQVAREVPRSIHLEKETQYSRRPSEDILEHQKPKCHVENCTHVEVRDSPVVTRRTVSKEAEKNDNNLRIYINEKEMEGVIDLAKDEDVGLPTSTPRRCFEEKLHYNSYFPTLSLGRRPIVSFYDKLH